MKDKVSDNTDMPSSASVTCWDDVISSGTEGLPPSSSNYPVLTTVDAFLVTTNDS